VITGYVVAAEILLRHPDDWEQGHDNLFDLASVGLDSFPNRNRRILATEVGFKLEEFKSTYRGRFVQAPNLSFHDVSEFGILIADKQEGDFRLQIRTLTAL
jgi:hypothetical protein